MHINFLNESIQVGSDPKKLKTILSRYVSDTRAVFLSNSFESCKTLSDGSPSIYAVLEVEDELVLIEAYSHQSHDDPNDPDYELFKADPKEDSYVVVYVLKDNFFARFMETETLKTSFSPNKAKSIFMSLTKCKTLKNLLKRGLSLGLKKGYEFEYNFPEFD